MPTTVPADGPLEESLPDEEEARELLALEEREREAVTMLVISAREVVEREVLVSGSVVVSGRVVVGAEVVSSDEKEVDVDVLSMVVVITDTEEEDSEVLDSVVSDVDVSESSVVVGVETGSLEVVRVRVEVAATNKMSRLVYSSSITGV